MFVFGKFFSLPLVLVACLAASFTTAGAADNTRYVSIAGNNANPCTLAKPCRTLQKAIQLAPAGGEVQVLDSGFYGNNATVNKSLTISGNGHTVYLGAVLTINKAGAIVALRGLVLDGQGTVANGINIAAAAAVHIERCVVHGFAQDGIIAGATNVELFVLDTISRDNGGRGLRNSGTGSSLTIDNSRFENNASDGVLVLSSKATIHRSTSSGNAGTGIASFNSASVTLKSIFVARNGSNGLWASSSGRMIVDSSVADGNGVNGLAVTGGGYAFISNSTFTNNAANGILAGNTVETRLNNVARGNTVANVSGTLTPIGGV